MVISCPFGIFDPSSVSQSKGFDGPYSIGQPGMALSISAISRIVSFKATTTF